MDNRCPTCGTILAESLVLAIKDPKQRDIRCPNRPWTAMSDPVAVQDIPDSVFERLMNTIFDVPGGDVIRSVKANPGIFDIYDD